jgi:cell division protein FtsN
VAKRSAQATRGGERRPWPAWAWLAIGVLLGLLLSALVLLRDWVPALRGGALPEPDPAAGAPGDAGITPELKPRAEDKPKYDFYSVLPEMEVVIPEAEIEAQAREAAPGDAAQRLFLQAGSFRSAPDAETMKARLALLGLRAQVVAVTVNGTNWHRVRVGPYAGARELDDARRTLAANGISAIALRDTTTP